MSSQPDLNQLLQSMRNGGASVWNSCRAESETVTLSQAELEDANLADFNFARADLSAGKLSNADLSGADLSNAKLTYTDLRRANLANAYLTGANLSACNLQGANMVDTNLDRAKMLGARLNGAYLVGASLIDAVLDKADLRGATLKFANLQGARLRGANVEDADLTGVELGEEIIATLVNYDRAIRGAGKKTALGNASRMPVEENYDELFRDDDARKILGVVNGASLDDITSAYRKRVKEYHPDRVAHLGEKLQYVARREFERIQLAYRSLTTHMSQPAVTIRIKGDTDLAKKDPKKYTIQDYIEMLKWQPNNDVLHFNIGVKYLQAGLIESAIRAYGKAIELNPKNAGAHHNLKLAKLMQTLES